MPPRYNSVVTDKIFCDPLLYDLAFSYDISKEINFYSSESKKHGKLLLPACGTGRYAVRMSKIFKSVYAFDINENMIDFAKKYKNNNNINYHTKDLLRFNKENEFDVAIIPNNSIRYILSIGEVESAIRNIEKSLSRNGEVFFELGLNDSYDSVGIGNEWAVNFKHNNKNHKVTACWKLLDIVNGKSLESVELCHYLDSIQINSIKSIQRQLIWTGDDFIRMIEKCHLEVVSVHSINDFEPSCVEKPGKHIIKAKKCLK